MMDGMAVRDTIPYNFDDEARAELLAFLVVGQLIARARSGDWLVPQHVTESVLLWLASNGANCDAHERTVLSACSVSVASQMLQLPGDAKNFARTAVLAVRQAQEQNAVMRTLEASGRLKHDLDEVQQMMLDEHGELYTLIGTRPFYKRAAYIFPLPALVALTDDARGGCRQHSVCLSRLADLDDLIQKLARRSNALAMRASLHPRSIGVIRLRRCSLINFVPQEVECP
jgi:hypothetical protein